MNLFTNKFNLTFVFFGIYLLYMSKKKTTEDFINESIIKHGDDHYDYSCVIYKNNNTKVKLICNIHNYNFDVRPNDHLSKGVGCLKCNNGGLGKKRKSEDILLNRFKNIHGNKYDYSLVNYVNSNTKVKILCPIHGQFEQSPRHHYNGRACPTCAGVKPYTTETFIKKSKEIHGDKYDYSLVKYKNNSTKVELICPKHATFNVRPNDHLSKKSGCIRCLSYDKDIFINKSNQIHNNKYDYSLVRYKTNQDKIKIICPLHSEFSQKLINHVNGTGCPRCNDSKGEKGIVKLLNDRNIKYEREYIFNDCVNEKFLKFDFYLIDYNLCIEYDGEYHFQPHWSDNDGSLLKKQQKRDKIKDKYCENNNIRLLRINYKEKDIEKILIENLK